MKWSGKCGREDRTGYEVTNSMVMSVIEIARYTEMHIRHNVLISGKL